MTKLKSVVDKPEERTSIQVFAGAKVLKVELEKRFASSRLVLFFDNGERLIIEPESAFDKDGNWFKEVVE